MASDVKELCSLTNATAQDILLLVAQYADQADKKNREGNVTEAQPLYERGLLLQAAANQLLIAERQLEQMAQLLILTGMKAGRERGLSDAIRDAANARTKKQNMLDELKKVVD